MSEQTIDTELKNRQQEFYQCLMKLLDDDVKELILKITRLKTECV